MAGLDEAVPADENVYLDVPTSHAQARQLAADLGMRPAFETARMYRGRAPAIDMRRVFGMTSFELG